MNRASVFRVRLQSRHFIGSIFLGGAAGAATATAAREHSGWSGVAYLGIGLAVIATFIQFSATLRRR